MKRPQFGASLGLTFLAFLFGASFVATKVALLHFTPAQLIFLRFLLAHALFVALKPWMPRVKVDRQGYIGILGLALIEPGVYFFLEALGIQRTLASTASVLISTIPVFILILEVFWLRTPIKPREVVLIFLSLIGILIVLTAGGWRKAIGGTLIGNMLVLGAALSASVYTVLARKLISTYDPVNVTRLQAFYASIIYLPFAGYDWLRLGWKPVGGEALLSLAYLAIGCSFLGYLLLNYALSQVKASVVGAFTNVIPIVATGLAVLLLGEKLYWIQLVGAAIVITSVTLLTRSHSDQTTTAMNLPQESVSPIKLNSGGGKES